MLVHKGFKKQQRGDVGEIIFAMIAPACFDVHWGDVSIVGAHMSGGRGDGGKDVIINGRSKKIIVDFKAWSRGSVNVKDARSIGGALMAVDRDDYDEFLGIVATNRTFTNSAVNYVNDLNTNAPGAFKVQLWNGTKLRRKIKSAINNPSRSKGWNENAGQFVTHVLCYLACERKIRVRPRDEDEMERAQLTLLEKTDVESLGELFISPE